jgi:hypothetical protein
LGTALPGLHVAALRLLCCSLQAVGGGAVPLHATAALLLAGQLRLLAAGSPDLMPWTVSTCLCLLLSGYQAACHQHGTSYAMVL